MKKKLIGFFKGYLRALAAYLVVDIVITFCGLELENFWWNYGMKIAYTTVILFITDITIELNKANKK